MARGSIRGPARVQGQSGAHDKLHVLVGYWDY